MRRESFSSSSSSVSYTSDETTTGSDHTSSYWTTDRILARNAAARAIDSAPPNSSMAYEPKRGFTPYISLGPVIGMVTDTTSRILIEVSDSCDVKCFLTDKYGVQHGCTRRCHRNTPTVFALDELRANTYYKVTFNIRVPGLVKAGFKTLPPGFNVSKHAARIAVVSTSDHASMRDDISHKNDLYKHLYEQAKKGEIDYLFHLGNVAFVDRGSLPAKKKGSGEQRELSAYEEAAAYCDGLHGELLAEAESRVCNIFRNVYRDTFSHPTLRHVLANVPNLMILNDREIKMNLGDDTPDVQTHRTYIEFCAYKVYNEYCRALFEDVPYQRTGGSLSSAMKVGQAYHFHAFGDLGFVFLDTRAQRTLHRDYTSEENLAFLGQKQWSDIDFALSSEGYLADCKVLVVSTTTPVAQCGEQAFLKNKKSLELAGSFNTPAHTGEASLLLSMLFDWKAQKPGRREVVLLSGSSTDAGMTEIVDLRYRANGDTRIDRIKQVTAGPTGAKPDLSSPASLSNACCGVNGLGIYHQFKHLNIIKKSNYAVLDIERPPNGETPSVETHHVMAMPKEFLVKKQMSNNTRAGGCWAAEPDDAGVRGLRHTGGSRISSDGISSHLASHSGSHGGSHGGSLVGSRVASRGASLGGSRPASRGGSRPSHASSHHVTA
eukprot:Protomagalhaensia_sp_Gyna_25__4258@NODE_387_length_3619_cov_99_504469_g297_i0_p1_GENE_NODE_387_length_3619_cov_99_504469_g297_i0NODE_387_length_3619_cov_99_504469_g297_i0_p1_ORF_typecomplete_len660_score118_58PhoD/PF09423_10/3e18Pecanex_C/PF05041_15/2_2Pecanex_C/PF05041_15/4_2e02_NODE_387_length_3619_cov_99_504469_g297_i0652044